MYMILKPKENKMNDVQNMVKDFTSKYEQQWSYFPEEGKLVLNKLETIKDGHLVYIISRDNNKVLETILKNKK